MGSFESTFSKVESIEGMLGRFMMKFHILTRDFFYRRISAPWDETVALPMYISIVQAFTLHEWATLPFIPAAYLKPKAGDEGKKKKARADSASPAGGNTNTPTTRAARLPNTAHLNPVLIARFTTWGRELNTVTSVAGVTAPYMDGSGRGPEHQVCLSYHLRKFCYVEGCRRAASHRQLTPSEVNAVAQFMTDVDIP